MQQQRSSNEASTAWQLMHWVPAAEGAYRHEVFDGVGILSHPKTRCAPQVVLPHGLEVQPGGGDQLARVVHRRLRLALYRETQKHVTTHISIGST